MHQAMKGIRASFQALATEAPPFSAAWMDAVEMLAAASALDEKTRHLAYIRLRSSLFVPCG